MGNDFQAYISRPIEQLPEGLSDWLTVCTIYVPSGELSICDPILYPHGAVVPVVPGKYLVQAIAFSDQQELRVARIRAYSRPGFRSGSAVAECSVDFGAIGFSDSAEHLRASRQLASLEDMAGVTTALGGMCLFAFVPWDKGDGKQFPCFEPGYGDGRYSVVELVCDGDRVGVESDFLEGLEG